MPITFRSLFERFRNKQRWLVALAFAALFAAHATLLRPVVQNGDTAVYNEQVELHDFGSRAIHSGYFLIGALFHALLPFRTDTSMNVMSLALGIGAAFALFATGSFLGSRAAGACSVVFLLCARAYVRAMLLAEVDILETSLVVMSFALYVRKRAAGAGLLFGLAMLSTPLSASTLPLFLGTFAVSEGGRWATVRLQSKRVFWFGICALAAYVPIVAWHFHSYVYGGRGLTTAARLPFDLAEQAARSWKFFALQSGIVLPLYLAAVLSALTDARLWRIDQPAFGIVLSVVVTSVAGDRTTDVPVQLPNLVLLSLLGGLFVSRLAAAIKAAWVMPLAAFLIMAPPAYQATTREIEADDRERRLYESMRAQSQPFQLMVVGRSGFDDTRVFERYAYGKSYVGLALSVRQFRSKLGVLRRAPARCEIWFLRGVPAATFSVLDQRYELTQRQAEGAAFHVLVPRPPTK